MASKSSSEYNHAVRRLAGFLGSNPSNLQKFINMCPPILHVDRPFTSNLYYLNNEYNLAQFLPGVMIGSMGRILSNDEILDQLKRLSVLLVELKNILLLQKEMNGVIERPEIYFESERLFITACIRKAVLVEALSKNSFNTKVLETPNMPVKDVMLTSFEWTPKETSVSRLVICVLYCETIVYCCPIQIHQSTKLPKYLGPYIFSRVPVEFEIKVKFFMMNFYCPDDDDFVGFVQRTKPPIFTFEGQAIINTQAIEQGFTEFTQARNHVFPERLLVCAKHRANPDEWDPQQLESELTDEENHC